MTQPTSDSTESFNPAQNILDQIPALHRRWSLYELRKDKAHLMSYIQHAVQAGDNPWFDGHVVDIICSWIKREAFTSSERDLVVAFVAHYLCGSDVDTYSFQQRELDVCSCVVGPAFMVDDMELVEAILERFQFSPYALSNVIQHFLASEAQHLECALFFARHLDLSGEHGIVMLRDAFGCIHDGEVRASFIEKLLDLGANPSLVVEEGNFPLFSKSMGSNTSYVPLMDLAVKDVRNLHSPCHLVALLLNRLRPNQEELSRLLTLAAEWPSQEVLELLINLGAVPSSEATALAWKRGKIDLFKLLSAHEYTKLLRHVSQDMPQQTQRRRL